jgi:hypothetical protein
MADLQPDKPAPGAWRFNPRLFLVKEWPYLLVNNPRQPDRED